MADVTVSPQTISRVGLDPSYTGSLDATDNYFVNNDGRTFLHVKKGTGTDSVVTVVTPGSVHGLAIADLEVTIPTSEERMIGPFPPGTFSDADFNLEFTVTEPTNLTVAAVRIG